MKLFKYITVGILLLASGSFFTFGDTLTQTPEAHAQSSLISAIGRGTAQGLGSCASNFIANEVIGGIAGKIGGKIEDAVKNRLNPTAAVPVTDSETQSQIQQGTQVQEARESCLDAVAYFAAKEMLDQLADDTLHWVESGFTQFGQPGNRAHIGNLGDFVSSVGDQTFNQFTHEYVQGKGDPLRPAPGATLADSCISPGSNMRIVLDNGYDSYEITNTENGQVVSSDSSGNYGDEIITGISRAFNNPGNYRITITLNGITESLSLSVDPECDTDNSSVDRNSNSRGSGSNGNGNGVCSNFSRNVLLSVATNYYSENRSETGIPASDAIANFGDNPAVGEGCELEQQIGVEATKSFLKGDFSTGGWQAFLTASQDPNSNPIGAYLSQRQNLNNRLQQSQELKLDELRQNNGWISAIACPKGNLDEQTGKCKIPAGQNRFTYEEPVINTPGSVVNEAVNNMVGSDFRRLELADEVNEIVGALANQLISNITGSGNNDSQGFFDPNLANRTNPLGNINEYSQGGSYNGPIPVDYIASTTAEQIELEEEILSILQQLPTRDELRQLEARLNQCLVNGDISEEFQGQDIASLIQGLFATHQNIFPGSELSEEREVGLQEVNWVGNDFEWTPGETYGLETCGGRGNHRSGYNVSYVADEYSGEWKAFMCLVKSGEREEDEFSEDDENFGADFENITNGYQSKFESKESASKDVTFTVPLFENRPLYREPRNDRVKIDWNGADFEWGYHDVYAGEFQRFIANRFDNFGKLNEITNYNPQTEINRYGARLCAKRTARDGNNPGQISYIVNPHSDEWTKQECKKTSDGYQFVDIEDGEDRPAFRMLDDIPATISQYEVEIEELIGEETYDNSYEEPVGGDDLYELLHDVQTLTAENPDSAELSARKQAVDARFGRLFRRFHSEADLEAVKRALELMNKNNNTSRYNQLLNHANINSCQLPSDWNTAESGSSGNGGGNNPGTGPQGPPVPNFDPPPSDFSALPAPSGDPTQIALVFMEGVQFDVWLNEQLVPASRDFDYELSGGAGVKVINLPNNLQTMRLDPDQIRVLGLNNDGFGGFAYKVVNKNPDFNMNTIHRNHDSSQGFWGNAASNEPLGIIVSRNGSTVYPRYPDPYFYQGYMFNPADLPERRDFESQWSDTGKVVFSFINYGQPANPPVRGLEDGYEGEDNQSNPPSISLFSASRVAPNYIGVEWEASADECVASSIPTVGSWNGPVGTSGSYAIFTSDDVYLRLTCSRDGSSTRSSYSVSGS